MKKEDIHLDDLYRIINGEIPLIFYIELILRTLFVYVVLTVGMKYLGKRQSSQLSRSELGATSTLAAATGLVLLAPERGLLPPVIIVLMLILAQRFIHKQSMRSRKLEQLAEGSMSILVIEGVMQLDAMKDARISREQLFAELRGSGITQLGEVKRLQLEANGEFSLIQMPEPVPGLSTIPLWDKDYWGTGEMGNDTVCDNCGHKLQGTTPCPSCGNKTGVQSYT